MERIIWEDTRQQIKPVDKHAIKHKWWSDHGVQIARKKLEFGDYMTDLSNCSVDTKKEVDEIAQNINGADHNRFTKECEKAADAGYRLIVLIENTLGYKVQGDVLRWLNGYCAHCRYYHAKKCMPRMPKGKCLKHGTRKPIQGERLYKAMNAMSMHYGVRFEFCAPEDTAKRICELLGVDYE